jgi:hypothetical protein
MKSLCLVLALLLLSIGRTSAAIIAHDGTARTVIVVDPAATAAESFAACQLASALQQITGASFEIRTNTQSPARSIIVGPGAAAAASFRDAPLAQLGGEELIIRAKGNRLLLAGGRPRGTLYAVSRFLQDACGLRWWTPWASRIPRQPSLRTADNAQLCLSNPELRDFVVERVKQALRDAPEARIISVSQNDCFNPCECDNCKALDDAEGSHAGSLLAFVNYIAEKIKPDFPSVAVDTLAYQYTRKPPRAARPRPNVIVRLCSIECDFRQTLDSPANAAFAADIRGWEQRADRLYVWDYVTDFAHYLQPFPDWFALGPNLRFFQAHHVRGVFEEGASESSGAEMAELRAWLLAQLLWNPNQDDQALIREFLDGCYGAAAQPLARYLQLMQTASQGFNLSCYSPTDSPFLRFKPLAQAEAFWQQAEQAVADNDELLARVRLGHLSVQCVWLARWEPLRQECSQAGATWPFTLTRAEFARQWLATAQGIPGKPWTKVTTVREGGPTPQKFISQLGVNP